MSPAIHMEGCRAVRHRAGGAGACRPAASCARPACRAARLPAPQAVHEVSSAPSEARRSPSGQAVLAGAAAAALLSAAAAAAPAPPALAAAALPEPAPVEAAAWPRQQHWTPPEPARAPALSGQQRDLALLAAVGEARPRVHWLISVLGIGAANALGLWAVLRLLAWGKDSSTPVTVLRLHAAARVDGSALQDKLRAVRPMLSVHGGMSLFVTLEEVVQLLCQPPRGAHVAYAELSAAPLRSKQEGYERFKQYAAVEQRAADAEEESGGVLHGVRPAAVRHRTPLQRLLGAEETQDAEESQACVVVTLVVLAAGTISVPPGAIRDPASFRSTMRQVFGGLSAGQLVAVELLMTPDSPSDFLPEAAVLQDYPFLTDLSTGSSIGGGGGGGGRPGAAAAGRRDGAVEAAA